MKDYKLNLHYFLRKAKLNKAGKMPLILLITCNGEQARRSTGISLIPEKWNEARQSINAKTKQETLWNREINELKSKILDYATDLQYHKEVLNLSKILSKFYGTTIQKDDFLTCTALIDLATEQFKKEIDNVPTQKKFVRFANFFKSFFVDFLKTPEISPEELKSQKLADDLKFFLLKVKKYDQAHASKVFSHFKRIFDYGLKNELIQKNPLFGHSIPKGKAKDLVFLTESELNLIIKYDSPISQPLQKVRDMFLIQSHTGFAYTDLIHFKSENIKISPKGETYIEGYRQKSNQKYTVPLLPQVKEILAKYGSPENLPKISNQKYNFYLKELCNIVGIKISITTHTARKTFAVMALNVWDIPIETVSKMLGHASIAMTQKYYAKISPDKVLKDTKHISNPELKIIRPTLTDLKFYTK